MRRPSARQRGTAIKYYLIGLLVVIVMIAIGIPGIRQTQREDQREVILENLATIEAAKIYYQVKHDVPTGTTVTLERLVDAQSPDAPLKELPPVMGGKYVLGAIGQPPTFVHEDGRVTELPKTAANKPAGGEAQSPNAK